jgi:hypothetical protein
VRALQRTKKTAAGRKPGGGFDLTIVEEGIISMKRTLCALSRFTLLERATRNHCAS